MAKITVGRFLGLLDRLADRTLLKSTGNGLGSVFNNSLFESTDIFALDGRVEDKVCWISLYAPLSSNIVIKAKNTADQVLAKDLLRVAVKLAKVSSLLGYPKKVEIQQVIPDVAIWIEWDLK